MLNNTFCGSTLYEFILTLSLHNSQFILLIMKKTLFLFVLIFGVAFVSFGQSQRLVLLEHFTQASCGPCATSNPAINALLNANPDKFTAIMYHTSWPGTDPMFNHNTVENGARTNYYSVNSVPNSVLDGNLYNGHPNGWDINTVNDRIEVASPFEVQIHHELSDDENKFLVNMFIVATESVNAGMKAQLAVIEKHIGFSSPPGSNGEEDFYNVMKKLLPNQSGVTLPAFEPGDYMIIQHVWEHQNVYDLDELAAVGFIQNNDSKEVLQAANSSSELFSPLYENDVEVTKVSNISLTNCNFKIQPEVKIRNNGSSQLTSLSIQYSMNGEEPVEYNWSGNLGFLESETVLLPESTFGLNPDYTLDIVLENPNEQDDEYTLNNTEEVLIQSAPQGNSTMVLYMILDDNPEETTWEVKNYEGEIIHEGGPYTTPGQTVLQELDFESTNCYSFTIYDGGGDGLSQGGSIAFGFGSTYLINEVDFGSKAEAQFKIEFTGLEETVQMSALKIFPNPASDIAMISFVSPVSEHYEFSMVNIMGEEVVIPGAGESVTGLNELRIDLSGLNPGIYHLILRTGDKAYTEKLIISK